MKRRAAAVKPEGHQTTQRLLDTAERLFGKHGYDGIGMRALARRAKVNLGAATYHYGSKKALYIEAFMRRFRPSNAEQLSLLRQAQASSQPLSVQIIVDCLVGPPYVMGSAHPNFGALLARNLVAPPAFLHAVLHPEIELTVQEYVAALQRCLPAVPVDLIRARVMFSMGSLLMFSANIGRLPPPGRAPPPERIFRELARFIAAGLQAAAGTDGADCAPAAWARRPAVPRA